MTDDGHDPFDSTDARWTKLGADIARAVRRQCPWWLSDHAQDIAQAALIKVMTSAKNREGERTLSSFYLYRLAHSAVVDEIRRRRRRREVTLEVVTETGEDRGSLEPNARRDPERDASLHELGAAVRDCLVAMKRERRLAVMLHLQEHPVPEAARILGWTVKRTRTWSTEAWRTCATVCGAKDTAGECIRSRRCRAPAGGAGVSGRKGRQGQQLCRCGTDLRRAPREPERRRAPRDRGRAGARCRGCRSLGPGARAGAGIRGRIGHGAHGDVEVDFDGSGTAAGGGSGLAALQSVETRRAAGLSQRRAANDCVGVAPGRAALTHAARPSLDTSARVRATRFEC